MVPVYKFKYEGETTKDFTKDQIYFGRKSKGGDLFARGDRSNRVLIFSYRFAHNRIYRHFTMIEKSHVKNHKEAMSYGKSEYWGIGDGYGIIGFGYDCSYCGKQHTFVSQWKEEQYCDKCERETEMRPMEDDE